MRLGIFEIIIIIVVIIVILLVTRIIRMGRSTPGEGSPPGEAPAARPAGRFGTYLKRMGGTFIITGIIILIAGISLFKWALQSYVWSFAIVVVGMAMLFLSKKR